MAQISQGDVFNSLQRYFPQSLTIFLVPVMEFQFICLEPSPGSPVLIPTWRPAYLHSVYPIPNAYYSSPPEIPPQMSFFLPRLLLRESLLWNILPKNALRLSSLLLIRFRCFLTPISHHFGMFFFWNLNPPLPRMTRCTFLFYFSWTCSQIFVIVVFPLNKSFSPEVESIPLGRSVI